MGNYDTPENWSGGAVPSPYESIWIANGGTAQSSGGNGANTVTLDGGSTLEVLAGITSNFEASENFYAGVTGTGTLSIGSQAYVTTNDLYLGYGVGSTGVVNMSGGYLSPFSTYIGYAGNANFTMTAGSTLQSTVGYVGFLAGSQGSIQLTNSTWKAEDQSQPVDITVGVQGSGEVQSTNSEISALNLVIGGSAASTGTVSVSGGSLNIENNIQVGNAGTGSLALTNSATGTSAGVSVGTLANASGTLSVTNSTLSSSGNVFIGQAGTGSLITDGAQISAPELFVGREVGSSGTAIVAGGTMTLTGELHVGAEGDGTFTLQDGGTLRTDRGNMGYTAAATGVVNILSGTWNNTQAIFVGVSGSGTLNAGASGVIESESGYIAQNAGSVGTVNVTGGTWEMSNTLAVGVNGTGLLAISDGGSVSSEWSQIGLHAGSSGTATVDNASWTTAQTLTIGDEGDGFLSLINGATVTAGSIEVAASAGVTGALSVTNSTLTTENLLGVNNASVEFSGAQLKLLGGSSVVDTLLIDGFTSGVALAGDGLTVDTQGGNAQIASTLTGTGALTKTGAGRLRLNSANTYSGGTTIEAGVVEITNGNSLGTGATQMGTAELRAIANVTVAEDVTVSSNQTATFSATSGNTLTLSTENFTVASGGGVRFGSAGNTGNVVFAPDELTMPASVSEVTIQAGTLTAGNERLGQLTAAADATTVATGATLNFQDNLTGGSIKALYGAGTVNTGTSSATTLTVQSGSFAGNIAGNGALVKEAAGTLTLSGQNAFIGGTTVNGGALIVDGDLSFGAGQAQVNADGTLGGSGILGTIYLNGGTVAPGSSAGTTLTAQNLYWESGVLLFDLGPTPETSDLLSVGGLQGFGTTYNFTFVDQGWVAGTTYTLIDFVSSDIDIANFSFTNIGLIGDFAYNEANSTLEFTVDTVPEPSTWALLGLGAVALGWSVWRRRTAKAAL